MKEISLQVFIHRNQECMGIYFAKDDLLHIAVKKIPKIKWSQTHKCWWLPLSKENYTITIKAIGSKTNIETVELKKYLEKKNKITAGKPPAKENTSKPATILPTASVWQISTDNLTALEQFVQQLKLKAYSPSTIRTYRNEFVQLLQLLKNKPVNKLTADDIKRYMVYAMEKQGISENTAHSRLNALKFYFEQVLGREKFFWEIPRPKKSIQLPKLLNEDEIRRLFNALTNKKHKAMLFTAYSAG